MGLRMVTESINPNPYAVCIERDCEERAPIDGVYCPAHRPTWVGAGCTNPLRQVDDFQGDEHFPPGAFSA